MSPDPETLQREMDQLRARLEAAEALVRACREAREEGAVVSGAQDEQLYGLRDADEPYRLLVEQINEGAAILSPKGEVLFSNSRLAAMLRVPLSGLIGAPLRQFVKPEGRLALMWLVHDAATQRSQQEQVLMASDDTAVPVCLSLSPFELEGRPLITLVVTDLTEQKRHQEIIAAKYFATMILDQTSDAIITCDPDGRVIAANRAGIELAAEHPMGQPFHEAFPLQAPEALNLLAPALTGQIVRAVEASLQYPGLPSIELLAEARPLLDLMDTPHGCVIRLTDITERKRAEQQLATLNEQLRGQVEELESVLQVLPVGVFIAHDPACTHITANAAGAAMLGIPAAANASKTGPRAAELPFRILREGGEVPHDTLPMQRAARTVQAILGEVLDVVRADGSVITLRVDAVPLFNAAGRLRGCVATCADISAQRRL